MQQVDLGPDGTIDFPDDFSEQQINEAVRSHLDRVEATKDQGYFGASASSFAQRAVAGVAEIPKGAASYFETPAPTVYTPTGEMGERPLPKGRFMRGGVFIAEPLPEPATETLKRTRANPLYQWGQRLEEAAQETYPVAPEREKQLGPRLAGGIGSFLPLVASGPLAPATISLQSMGQHLTSDFEALKDQGLSEEAAAQKTLDRALASGITQGVLFMVLPIPLRKIGDKYLIDKFGKTALSRFVAARAAGAGEMAALLPISQVAENVIGDQPLTTGTGQAFLEGALLGAVTQPRRPTLREQKRGTPFRRGQRLQMLKADRERLATLREYERQREPELSEIIEEPPIEREAERASTERIPETIPEPEIRPPVGQETPLRQPGEVAPEVAPSKETKAAEAPKEELTASEARRIVAEHEARTKELGDFIKVSQAAQDKLIQLEATGRPPEFTPAEQAIVDEMVKRGVDSPEDFGPPGNTYEQTKQYKEALKVLGRGGLASLPLPKLGATEAEKAKFIAEQTKQEPPPREPSPTELEYAGGEMPRQPQVWPTPEVKPEPPKPESVTATVAKGEAVPETFEQRMAREEDVNDWIKSALQTKRPPKDAEEAWQKFTAYDRSRGVEVLGKDYFLSAWRSFEKPKEATPPPSDVSPKQSAQPEKPIERLIIKPRTDGLVTLEDSSGHRIGTFKDVDEAGRSAISLGYDIALGSELKPSWTTKPGELTAAESASQSSFEKLGAAEKGAYDKSARKGMTKKQLAKLEEFDRLDADAKRLKEQWRASKPQPPEEPPAPSIITEPPAEGMTAQEALSAVRSERNERFAVETVSPAEAVELTGRDEARNYAGFFYKGKVHLVPENLPKGDVQEARQVMREEVGHGLLRTIEGRRLLDKAISEGRLHLTEGEKNALRKQGYSENEFLDEFIAKSAREERPWWKRMVETVRGWLEKLGLAQLTNEETARLLLKQIRRARSKNEFSDAVVSLGERREERGDGLPELAAARKRNKNVQMLGYNMGAADVSQPVEPIKEKLRPNFFNSLDPVTPETTARAINLAQQLSGAIKGKVADEVKAVVGEQADAALVLLRGELTDYAIKVLRETGDQTLFRLIRENWGTMAAGGSGAGLSEFGRGLVAVQDMQSYKLVKMLFDQMAEAMKAGRKALGVGEDLWNRLLSGLRDLKLDPSDLGEVEIKPEKGKLRKLKEVLDEATGDAKALKDLERQALRKIDEFQSADTEWLKPGPKKNALNELLDRYIKPKANSGIPNVDEEFVRELSVELRKLGLDLVKIGRPLAEEAWQRRVELEATARQRAMEREAKNIADAAERAAKALADKYEMTEFPGKKAPNEVVKIIKDFIKGEPERGEPPLSDALTYEPLAELLMAAGVRPETARRLSGDVYVDRRRRWENARARAISLAAERGSLRPLIERIQESPYLAQKSADWRKNAAEDYFMANGLSSEQAKAAAVVFDAEFGKRLEEAGVKYATQLLDGVAEPTRIDDIVKGIRSGLLDPNRHWSDTIAERSGWKPVSEADFKQLAELELKISDPATSAPERSEATDKMFTIMRRYIPDPDMLTTVASNLVAGNLTGFSTLGVNIFAPQVQNAFGVAMSAVTSPRDFPAMLKGMLSGYKTWLTQNKNSLQHDAYTLMNNDYEASQNTLKHNWESGQRLFKEKSKLKKAEGAARMLIGAQQYWMRMLTSLDNANGMLKAKTAMGWYASNTMRHLGFSTKEIRDAIAMRSMIWEQFYADGIEKGLTQERAVTRAEAMELQEFRDFLNNKQSGLGSEAFKSTEADTYSELGRLAPGVKEMDEGGVISRTVGAPLLQVSNWMRSQPGLMPAIGVSLFGYVAVPYRAARFVAWGTYYGLFRLGIHHWRKATGRENWWKQSLATEAQERYRLKMAMAGSAVLSLLTAGGVALIRSSADDGAGEEDDTGVYFTGDGPKNKNLRSAWLARGFQPNSIVMFVDGKPVAVPMTRSGETLAHFGWLLSARDQKAWKDKEAAAAGRTIEPSISRDTAGALGTYLGLMGQRGFLQTALQAGRALAPGGDPRQFLADKGTQFGGGLLIPFTGLQRSIASLALGETDRSSISAAIVANLPVLALAGGTAKVVGNAANLPGLAKWGESVRQPLLNRLGDPLYNPDESWYHKMRYTGIPIAIRVKNTEQNRAIYGMLVDKGVSPPELRRATFNEKYGEGDNEEFRQFVQLSGGYLKKRIDQNLPALQGMTPADAKAWLDKEATAANTRAADEMGLTPMKPTAARRSGGSAMTLPGAGAATTIGAFGGGSRPSRRLTLRRGRRGRTPRLRLRRGRTRRLRVARLRTPRLRGFRRPRLRRPQLRTTV